MSAAELPAPQIGRILIAAGLLTEEQLAHALEEQRRTGKRLGEIVVQSGFISGPALANALAEQHGGVLKTEYGFASGLGGLAARRAAFESGASISPLRPPDPTPLPQLRTVDLPAAPALATGPESEVPAESNEASAVPPVPAEPVPLEPEAVRPLLRPADPPPELEPEPELAQEEATAVSETPVEPLRFSPQPEPVQPLLRPAEPAPPATAPEPEPEAPTFEPLMPIAAAEPIEKALQLEPEPALEPDQELELAPAAALPDERDALIDSLRARLDAQEDEIATLREQLEQERERKDVQVHVWPEEQPSPEPSATSDPENYLLCVPTPAGYVLFDRVGALPTIGEAVAVPEENVNFTVTKVVRLPRNGRLCAYLQRA